MAKFNENNQCELIVKGILDKEEGVNTFEAMVKLKTQSAFANPARMISTVSYLDFYLQLKVKNRDKKIASAQKLVVLAILKVS